MFAPKSFILNRYFFSKICPKRAFSIRKRKIEHHHWIQNIQIGLDAIFSPNKEVTFVKSTVTIYLHVQLVGCPRAEILPHNFACNGKGRGHSSCWKLLLGSFLVVPSCSGLFLVIETHSGLFWLVAACSASIFTSFINGACFFLKVQFYF